MLLVDLMPRFPVPTTRQRLARASALRLPVSPSNRSLAELEVHAGTALRDETRSSQAKHLAKLSRLDAIAFGVAFKLVRTASGRYANGMDAYASRGLPIGDSDPEMLAYFVARVKQMAMSILNLDVNPHVRFEERKIHLTIDSR